jgi:FAD-dependent urate hydroxylase
MPKPFKNCNFKRTQIVKPIAMRILVAGAGIGGLTFVRALRYFHTAFEDFNHSIDIVERSQLSKDGVAIVLHPNGLHVLDAIGLLQHIIPYTNIIHEIKLSREDEDITIRLRDVWGDENVTRSILRKHLHNVLSDGVSLRMGCSLQRITQQGDDVIAHFDNGESKVYDMVIGADGVHSKLREMLFPGAAAVPTGLFYFRFIAKNTLGINKNVWRTFEVPGGSYGFIPLAEGLLHCFIQIHTKEPPCARAEEEKYIRQLIASWGLLPSTVMDARCGAIQSGFAYMVQPGNWSSGRCVLLGDAAHAVSPTLSEGGSLAMEDGLVLSLALCGTASVDEAIALYTAARKDRCMRAWRMSLAQLNSLRNAARRVAPLPETPTRLMAGMYKPLAQNVMPEQLESLLARAKSNKLFTNLNTK